MDNKEIKTTATELNDDALENVSGGEYQRLLKPIIIGGKSDSWAIYCVGCKKMKTVSRETYDYLMANGGYYCDECKANMAANNP